MNTKVLIIALLAVAGMTLAVPTASAALDAGVVLGTDSPDMVPTVDSADTDGIDDLCFADEDEDGEYDSGEGVYLTIACGTVAVNDLRLNGAGGQDAGSKVRTQDNDHGITLVAPQNQRLVFYDENGNGVFDGDDTVYLCITRTDAACEGSPSVAIGWLRLSGFGSNAAGSTVSSGASDINLGTTGMYDILTDDTNDVSAWDAFWYWDLDGDGTFNNDDVMYLDTDGVPGTDPSNPEVNHVRLGALGGTDGFGQVLGPDTIDTVAAVDSATDDGMDDLCFADEDEDSEYDAGEGVYLTDACGTVAVNDLRLNSAGGQESGSKVRTQDNDHGITLVAPQNQRLVFYDENGNGVFDGDDTVYLCITRTDTACEGSPSVAIGWIRMSGFGSNAAGSTVSSGASDINLGTSGMYDILADDSNDASGWDAFWYWDLDGDGTFNNDDVMYLDTDGDAATDPTNPQVNHVRLGALGGTDGFGQVLTAATSDTVAAVDSADGDAIDDLCFADEDEDSEYDAGEGVYLTIGCGTVAVNDLRLNSAGGQEAGSKVRTQDNDHGITLVAPQEQRLVFYDENGNGVFDGDDTVYLCITRTDGACAGSPSVAIGWLRLSGFGSNAAGSSVSSGASDINLGTTGMYAAPTDDTTDVSAWDAFWYWDLDGDGTFNNQDVMYVDTDGDADTDPTNPEINFVRISMSDVEVTGGLSPTTPSTPTTPTDPTEPTTPTEPTDPTEPTTPTEPTDPTEPTTPTDPTDPTTPTDPSDPDDGEDEPTPGFGLVAVLAALGAVAVVLRRRQ